MVGRLCQKPGLTTVRSALCVFFLLTNPNWTLNDRKKWNVWMAVYTYCRPKKKKKKLQMIRKSFGFCLFGDVILQKHVMIEKKETHKQEKMTGSELQSKLYMKSINGSSSSFFLKLPQRFYDTWLCERKSFFCCCCCMI